MVVLQCFSAVLLLICPRNAAVDTGESDGPGGERRLLSLSGMWGVCVKRYTCIGDEHTERIVLMQF